jgi:hypothetical protein
MHGEWVDGPGTIYSVEDTSLSLAHPRRGATFKNLINLFEGPILRFRKDEINKTRLKSVPCNVQKIDFQSNRSRVDSEDLPTRNHMDAGIKVK